eukprot:CAMPEP_0185029546 /NCGR_PEP_ID=MMETSP1103-20130426/15915_1 /TAXON_ID=36769 /ORGANISM="Paraphysomonas bandaiensis, Strain Caron Lab Isolate" /LENGTH=245 /DNA_ID=CAMNT_0027564339 /DNA_START=73 /DNA_END=807 /DNA_ORIENTATION=-
MKLTTIVLFICVQFARSLAHYTVALSIPHNSKVFTQGLEYHKGYLYESGGNYGRSSIQILHPDSGETLKKRNIEKKYFAEGITIVGNKVYMLTWKEKVMLVFDADTLELLSTYHYQTHSGEGWGLTYDGHHLIASDGSDHLTFFEVPTGATGTMLTKVREVRVRDVALGHYIHHVNELEMVDGFIYANIWYVDALIIIDPSTGHVVRKLDFRQLYPKMSRPRSADCFNGIAYNTTDGSLMVTGKW